MIPAYPEVQRKAHEELDHVVGHDRLPTVEDGKNLPYCHAIIKEVSMPSSFSRYFELIHTGRTDAQSLLAGNSPCIYRGYHLQGAFYPQEFGCRLELLDNAPRSIPLSRS